MKPSVRPLFSILVVAVFAATLVSRSFLLLRRPPPPPLFNSTFLRYASIDLAEPKSKQHIQELLQGNLTSVPWLRRHPQTRPPPPTAVPSIFRSPRLNRFWLDFMTLLQDWSRKKSFHPEIMSELVRLVKQPLDRLNGVPVSDHRRYSSCAVVGNSGILLNSSHGSLIDSHEMVIRLNNARIKPFERDVGSKTSLSFVNSNILHLCAQRQRCFCHPYGPGAPLLMYICQPIHLLDFSLCNSTHGGPLLITDPRFDVLIARIVKYYSVRRFMEGTGRAVEEWAPSHEGSLFHYSSGVQAVMLALGVCERVSMFGFGKSDSAKHHYHTNQKVELSLHDYEAEYAFYADLVGSPRLIPFVSDRFKFPPVVMYQ